MIHHIALNSWDQLYNIISLIIKDGGAILGISYGQFGIILLGILLPIATLMFLISACTALTNSKTARIVAIVTLCLGCLALTAFLVLAVSAVILGDNWAFTSYQ